MNHKSKGIEFGLAILVISGALHVLRLLALFSFGVPFVNPKCTCDCIYLNELSVGIISVLPIVYMQVPIVIQQDASPMRLINLC